VNVDVSILFMLENLIHFYLWAACYVCSSYRSSRLGLSHWDTYAMHRGGCLELYYCNMVEWSWWDSILIWKTNCFPSVP